jgi:hypothetical protein
MLELKWGKLMSPEVTDLPPFLSKYSASSIGAEP